MARRATTQQRGILDDGAWLSHHDAPPEQAKATSKFQKHHQNTCSTLIYGVYVNIVGGLGTRRNI